jgi:hypothetical protein
VIDPDVVASMDAAGVRFCLIGAQALAVRGVPRFTADIDFLTMDTRVLARSFWGEPLAERIERLRRGDDDDPLGGVVRFGRPRAVDVIVGRGELMRAVVEAAELDPTLGVRIPSALHLALLKLDAGGVQDIADVYRLVVHLRELAPDDDLFVRIEANTPSLSDWGRRAWARLKALADTAPDRDQGA